MIRPASLTLDELRRHPLPPVEEADKDAHGKLLLIAGSSQTPGSAAIAATAAMRSGCRKIGIATVEPMTPHIAMAVPEALVIALPMGRYGGISRAAVGRIMEQIDRFDAVVAGPGMNRARPASCWPTTCSRPGSTVSSSTPPCSTRCHHTTARPDRPRPQFSFLTTERWPRFSTATRKKWVGNR